MRDFILGLRNEDIGLSTEQTKPNPQCSILNAITKPERIIKRIIKAVGQRQSVLIIGDWDETLTKGIRGNENSIQKSAFSNQVLEYQENSFTRIIADYEDDRGITFYKEIRRLLLPTGMLIVSANCELNIFEKLFNKFSNQQSAISSQCVIKPKVLQDQIHDNGFLIDGYYGYPGGHLLMMAEIQNKEVTTLFTNEKQETIVK